MMSDQHQSLQWIAESDLLRIDYDPDRGMYRFSIFRDGHYQDEVWFDEYIFRRDIE